MQGTVDIQSVAWSIGGEANWQPNGRVLLPRHYETEAFTGMLAKKENREGMYRISLENAIWKMSGRIEPLMPTCPLA